MNRFINKDFARFIKETNERFSEFAERLNAVSERIRTAFSELPEQSRQVQTILAKQGWYLSGKVMPGEIAALYHLSNDDKVAIEEVMIKYAEHHFNEIWEDVVTSWPERAAVLNDAFEVHENEKYTLSIPVMLTQGDGFSFEMLGVNFYSKEKDGSPITARASKETIKRKEFESSYIDDFFLTPLSQLCSIAEGTKERDRKRQMGEYFGPLNRHGVLHGLDFDYASRANSLRAVLILDYLTDLKKHYF